MNIKNKMIIIAALVFFGFFYGCDIVENCPKIAKGSSSKSGVIEASYSMGSIFDNEITEFRLSNGILCVLWKGHNSGSISCDWHGDERK